jgi:hypothetical protein
MLVHVVNLWVYQRVVLKRQGNCGFLGGYFLYAPARAFPMIEYVSQSIQVPQLLFGYLNPVFFFT